MIDRPDLPCRIETGLPPADADDVAREFPFPQCQSDRATDQPDADDGYRIVLSHAGILKAAAAIRRGARSAT